MEMLSIWLDIWVCRNQGWCQRFGSSVLLFKPKGLKSSWKENGQLHTDKRRHHTEPWGQRQVEEQPESEDESARYLWSKEKWVVLLPSQLLGQKHHSKHVPYPPHPLQPLMLCPEYLPNLSAPLPLCRSHHGLSYCISHFRLCCSLHGSLPPSSPDILSFLSRNAIPGFLSKYKLDHIPRAWAAHTLHNAVASLGF